MTNQQRKMGTCSRKCKGKGAKRGSCLRVCLKGGKSPKRRSSRSR